MGFFSQDCTGCGHPLLCEQATTEGINEWMNGAVSIAPGGELHVGSYDGYGRIGGAEMAVGAGQQVYHRACWELAGKPTEFTAASADSEDQGWFFDDPEHQLPDPRLARRPARTDTPGT